MYTMCSSSVLLAPEALVVSLRRTSWLFRRVLICKARVQSASDLMTLHQAGGADDHIPQHARCV